MPSNMVGNTNHTTLLKKSKSHKMSPLNASPLKFRVQDNFYVLCQFLASACFWREIVNSLRPPKQTNSADLLN